MRLIDADSIKYEKRTECFGHGEFFEIQKVYKETIDAMPTVNAVPVVRCKDCKWWRDFDCMNANGANTLVLNEDWFCASGERKDND